MRIRIFVSQKMREEVYKRLPQAYKRGELCVVRRIQALLYIFDGESVEEVAHILDLSQQTIYNYVNAGMSHGIASLGYKRPPGRPAKLTKTQRRKLAELIDQGPEACGYVDMWICGYVDMIVDAGIRF